LPEGRRDDQGRTQKRKHPTPELVTLRKALSGAETEVIEEDYSECMDHIKTALAALSK
jgi:hypothetical protein